MPATARANSRCGSPARATRRSRAPAAASSRPSRATRAASEDELVRERLPRLDALIAEGVTTVEIKSGYGLDLESRAQDAARRAAARAERAGRRPHDLSRRARPAARISRATAPAMSPRSPTRCCRRSRRRAWSTRSTPSARGSPSRPRRSRRVFERARGRGLPVKLHADQLSNCTARRWRPSSARSRPIISNTPTRRASRRWRAPASSRCCCPAPIYMLRETQAPPVDAVPPARRADGGGDRLQSRHLAADLAAAGDEHGRDSVPPDGRRVPGRRHARGGARARPRRRKSARSKPGKSADLAIWDIERPAELVYRIGFNPLHARVWRGR